MPFSFTSFFCGLLTGILLLGWLGSRGNDDDF